MSYGFEKTHRLRKRSEYNDTFDHGTKVACSSLVVVGCKSASSETRMGLVVSKKVGNAVIRNKVKRTLREGFRHIQASYPGIDLVVIARPNIVKATNTMTHGELSGCLRRLRKKLYQPLKQ